MRFALLTLLLLLPLSAQAATQPWYQDIKLPTQKVIEAQYWTAPIAANTTVIQSGFPGPNSAGASTVSSGFTNPDFARNVVIQAGGTNVGNIGTCPVVVNGTNYLNHSINETLSVTSGASVVGSKAFSSVTSLVFPANCLTGSTAGLTWNLGTGVKLGLKRCMVDAGHAIQTITDGVKDTSAATFTVGSGSSVEQNTVVTNAVPNGGHNFEAFFVQNFLCTY